MKTVYRQEPIKIMKMKNSHARINGMLKPKLVRFEKAFYKI